MLAKMERGESAESAGIRCTNSGSGATLWERENKDDGRTLADAAPTKQY
jgi:hypothetical protein